MRYLRAADTRQKCHNVLYHHRTFFPFLFLHRQAATNDSAIVMEGEGGLFWHLQNCCLFLGARAKFLDLRGQACRQSPAPAPYSHTRVYLFIFIKIFALVFRPIVCVLVSADPLTRRHVRNLLCFALLRRRAVVALGVSKSGRGFSRGRGGNNHNYYLDNFTLISPLQQTAHPTEEAYKLNFGFSQSSTKQTYRVSLQYGLPLSVLTFQVLHTVGSGILKSGILTVSSVVTALQVLYTVTHKSCCPAWHAKQFYFGVHINLARQQATYLMMGCKALISFYSCKHTNTAIKRVF